MFTFYRFNNVVNMSQNATTSMNICAICLFVFWEWWRRKSQGLDGMLLCHMLLALFLDGNHILDGVSWMFLDKFIDFNTLASVPKENVFNHFGRLNNIKPMACSQLINWGFWPLNSWFRSALLTNSSFCPLNDWEMIAIGQINHVSDEIKTEDCRRWRWRWRWTRT